MYTSCFHVVLTVTFNTSIVLYILKQHGNSFCVPCTCKIWSVCASLTSTECIHSLYRTLHLTWSLCYGCTQWMLVMHPCTDPIWLVLKTFVDTWRLYYYIHVYTYKSFCVCYNIYIYKLLWPCTYLVFSYNTTDTGCRPIYNVNMQCQDIRPVLSNYSIACSRKQHTSQTALHNVYSIIPFCNIIITLTTVSVSWQL